MTNKQKWAYFLLGASPSAAISVFIVNSFSTWLGSAIVLVIAFVAYVFAVAWMPRKVVAKKRLR